MNFFKKVFVLIIIIIMIPTIVKSADETDILTEQKNEFGIKEFLKEAKSYFPEYMKDLDIQNIFSMASTGKVDNISLFKKILSLLGSEAVNTVKILINILVIIIIHSILKTLGDSLENGNISKIVYYVEYILIVTVIMSNFSEILSIVNKTTEDLIGFTKMLIPLLITLMIYTGSITTSTVLEPILIFLIEFISNLIRTLIMPIVSIIVVFIIISKITDKVQISKLSSFMKSSVIWVLGIILTVFVGILSLEGGLTASVDGITAKTTKAAVSSLIPVVGKILGDSVDAVLGSGIILKNAVGMVGVIIIIGICILPIIKLATFSIMYAITSAIAEPLADEKIVKLLKEMSDVFKILLAIVCSVSVLFVIGITLVIKISNSGMMYR